MRVLLTVAMEQRTGGKEGGTDREGEGASTTER